MNFEHIVNNRRAVNFFNTEKDISDEDLRKIVEMAAKTPSSFNLQPWSLMILRKKEEKERLRKLAMDQPKVSEAPVTLIVLADRDAWKPENPFVEKLFRENVKSGLMTEEQKGWFDDVRSNLYGQNNETTQAFACKNTGFFAMTLMYAAKSLDIDSHPMDGFDHDGIRKEFNIPENYWIPLLISLGYFDTNQEKPGPKWRKSYEDIVVRF